MEEVKEYLGHSSIRVTSDRYGHLFPKAREAMRDGLDQAFIAATQAPLADLIRTFGDTRRREEGTKEEEQRG